MRFARLAVLLAACTGCSTTPASPAPPAPTAAPAPAVAPSPPALPPVHVDELHAGEFEGEVLDACIDLVRVFDGPFPVGWAPTKRVEDVLALDKSNGQFAIRASCERQFSGMKPLAFCRTTRLQFDGVPYREEELISFFRYETALERHGNMKDCLAAGGEWHAVAEDSREARKARAGRRMGQALGLARASGEFAERMEAALAGGR